MSRRDSVSRGDPGGAAKLTLFPIAEEAIKRLALTVTPEQLREKRLTTMVAIVALLEPLLNEVDRLETLARELQPAPSGLIQKIADMRAAAKRLYSLLSDTDP